MLTPRNVARLMSSQQRYWILTVPLGADCYERFPPTELPGGVSWLKGQQELATGGLLHWQVIAGFSKPSRLPSVIRTFPGAHAEPTRSSAADLYVWKDETAVPDTRFELGTKSLRRNNKPDWDSVWTLATTGDFSSIPSDIRVRHYSSLRRIATDHLRPLPLERIVHVLWGQTGTGKSRTAWREGGLDCFPKVPTTVWWDGYRGHECVIIDEFCGNIGITHLLRWFDRYPCSVEIKGGHVPLAARRFYLTSNVNPEQWYPDASLEQQNALFRRFTSVRHVIEPIVFEDEK